MHRSILRTRPAGKHHVDLAVSICIFLFTHRHFSFRYSAFISFVQCASDGAGRGHLSELTANQPSFYRLVMEARLHTQTNYKQHFQVSHVESRAIFIQQLQFLLKHTHTCTHPSGETEHVSRDLQAVTSLVNINAPAVTVLNPSSSPL